MVNVPKESFGKLPLLPTRYCTACGTEQRINNVRKEYNKHNGKLCLFVYYRCPNYRFWNMHNDNLEYFMDLVDIK